MRQIVFSMVGYAVTGAVIAVLAVLIGVDRRDLVLDSYLVFAAGLAAIAAARISGRAFPRPRGTVPALLSPPPKRYVHPESLSVMEDDVALAQADQFDLHFRLRPLVRDITAAGLTMRAGIDLDREPGRAQERLSPPTWELVRPDRPRPASSGEQGIDTGSLTAMVSELETLLPP